MERIVEKVVEVEKIVKVGHCCNAHVCVCARLRAHTHKKRARRFSAA